MSRPHNCCRNYTRSQLLRAAARRGRQGAAGDRAGMPRAGRHRAHPAHASSRAAPAWRWPSTAPRKIPLAAFEDGIAQAAPGDKVLVSVFFDGGIDSLSVLAPVGDSALRAACGRPWRSRPTTGTRLQRGPALRWHPAAPGWRRCTPRARSASSRRSATTSPNQSHFTSRHYYEIGEVEVGFRTGWLGRYIDLRRRRREPTPGALDGRRPLADARDRRRSRWRRSTASPTTTSGPRVDDPISERDVPQLRPLRLLRLRLGGDEPGPPARPPQTDEAARGAERVQASSPARSPTRKLLRRQARRPGGDASPPGCRSAASR